MLKGAGFRKSLPGLFAGGCVGWDDAGQEEKEVERQLQGAPH